MKRYSLLAITLGFLTSATVVHAHPGHGEPGNDFSVVHYVTEPAHLAAGLGCLIGAILLTKLVRASLRRFRRKTAST